MVLPSSLQKWLCFPPVTIQASGRQLGLPVVVAGVHSHVILHYVLHWALDNRKDCMCSVLSVLAHHT